MNLALVGILLIWTQEGPAAATQEEPRPQEEFPLAPGPEEARLLDLGWLELQPRLGMGVFTEDFHIDPSPYVSVLARAPVPWLSPDSDLAGDYFGIFAEVTLFPRVERDLEPEPEEPSGSCLFISLGLDFTLIRSGGLLVTLQAGGVYGWYGGISNLEDGWASQAGLTVGVTLGRGITFIGSPEVVFAHAGDRVYLGSVGLQIGF